MRRTQARARVLAGAGGGDNPVLARLREIQVHDRAEREELTTSEATTACKGGITTPADVRKVMGPSAGDRVVFTHLPGRTTIMQGNAVDPGSAGRAPP